MDFSLGREIKNDITGGPFRLGLELCETRQFKFFFLALQFFYLVVSNTLTLKLNVI